MKGLLPEKQSHLFTTDMMFEVCRLRELGRKARVPLFLCSIDLQKVYDSVDRTLLRHVLARFGVPPQIIEVIHQFHDGRRAGVQSDDGVCSEWFEIAQGPCQGSVFSPLLFNIFFAAVLSSQFRYSARIRTYSQILPIFKSICLRLALKRHWNVHDVQLGK